MSTNIRTINQLAARVAQDTELKAQLQSDPEGTLARVAAPIPDNWIYRIVVASLGLAVLIALVGAIIISLHTTKESPDVLPVIAAIGSAAVGALAGLLAPSPRDQ